MVGCSIRNCKSRSVKGGSIKFFSFPSKESVANEWLRYCGSKTTTKNGRVCSVHFLQSDYIRPLHQVLLKSAPQRVRHLKPDAIPTLHIDSTSEQNTLNISGEEISEIVCTPDNNCLSLNEDAEDSKVVDIPKHPGSAEDIHQIEPRIPDLVAEPSKVAVDSPKNPADAENLHQIEPCIPDLVAEPSKVVVDIPKHPGGAEDLHQIEPHTPDLVAEPAKVIVDILRHPGGAGGLHQIESHLPVLVAKPSKVVVDVPRLPGGAEGLRKIAPHPPVLVAEPSKVVVNILRHPGGAGGLHQITPHLPVFSHTSVFTPPKVVKESEKTISVSVAEYKSLKRTACQFDILKNNLEKVFTPGQIRCLMAPDRHRIIWSEDDIAAAIKLRKISSKAYRYLKYTIGVPLPALSTLRMSKFK